MNIEEDYNKWQCTDIEDKYKGNIERVQFTKSELLSFAEYHKKQSENVVLDGVIECRDCDGLGVVYDVVWDVECYKCKGRGFI